MFENRLKEIRIEKGLNMRQMAKLLDIQYTTYVGYEKNEREPNSEVLIKMADTLGVTADYLLGRDSKEETEKDDDFYLLELELRKLGVSIGFYEEDAMLWLEFPDGTLEITEKDLADIQQSTLNFLKFRLMELREKHPEDFRKKKRSND